MAKIALDVDRALARRAAAGEPGAQSVRLLERGDGWSVRDVLCSCGPEDRPFEERHQGVSIAIVVAGSFEYRADARDDAAFGLMTPGSLLLGNPGQHYECAHAHAAGDRCVAFHYAPDFFERLAIDAGAPSMRFRASRLPAVRALSPAAALASAGLEGTADVAWEELALQVAARALHAAGRVTHAATPMPAEAVARVTKVVRAMDRHRDRRLPLGALARAAGLSPYHFLRTFARVTGVTPHQYVRRARLRAAAARLAAGRARTLDVALECGFNDLSNFNRAFRAEFGVPPRGFPGGGPGA